MKNFPKEIGHYPVIWYNEYENVELTGTAIVTRKVLETGEFKVYWLTGKAQYAETSSTYKTTDTHPIEFGPKIDFPKGGWR